MELFHGEVSPGDSVEVDDDLKKGEMRFEPAEAKAAR